MIAQCKTKLKELQYQLQSQLGELIYDAQTRIQELWDLMFYAQADRDQYAGFLTTKGTRGVTRS